MTFSNGVEAWLKPTDFKNDQVLFTMYAQGGTSLAPKDDYIQASFATNYVGLSGLGGIKALDLDKMLAGQIASASPFIAAATHGINGSAAPAELATALQLLYLNFTAPGDDPDSLALMRRQLDAALANRGRSPGQAFGEKVDAVNTQNHYTSEPLTPEQVASLDRARMLAFYKARFSNAADFTLLHGRRLQGGRRTAAAGPLGRRPPLDRRAQLGVQGPRHPLPHRPAEGRSAEGTRTAQLRHSSASAPTRRSSRSSRRSCIAATSVLETVLRDSLREDLGQTYTVSVGAGAVARRCGATATSAVQFGAAPENIDAMTERRAEGGADAPDRWPAGRPGGEGARRRQARLRDGAEAEQLLAASPADGPPARRQPA